MSGYKLDQRSLGLVVAAGAGLGLEATGFPVELGLGVVGAIQIQCSPKQLPPSLPVTKTQL